VGLLVVVAQGGPALGRGPLAPPSLTDPSSWAAWAGARAPLEATFAVLAQLVVVLAWYLLAVTGLGLAARLWGGGRLVPVVDVLTLPLVRHSLHAAFGICLVVPTAAAIAPRPAVAVGVAEPGAELDEPTDDEGTGPPVMRLLPEQAPDEPPEADVIPVTPASPTSERLATEWEVQPGDHLWSVAERALGQAGATHGDGEVAQYWLRLIEANAGRLADPANPDLIFPGQFLTLPALSSSGEGALP